MGTREMPTTLVTCSVCEGLGFSCTPTDCVNSVEACTICLGRGKVPKVVLRVHSLTMAFLVAMGLVYALTIALPLGWLCSNLIELVEKRMPVLAFFLGLMPLSTFIACGYIYILIAGTFYERMLKKVHSKHADQYC
jgi:hypothetical protein